MDSLLYVFFKNIYSRGSIPYCTVPYPTVFREEPFRSIAQRTVLFCPFSVIFFKKRQLIRDLNVYILTLIFRLSANSTVPTHFPFFMILTLKTLFWWSLLEKREPNRDEFLYMSNH